MRILIVDDDPTSLLVLSSILSKQGHETISARDGLEAYRIILEQQITLVISDWNMPGLDGLGLCQRIRAQRLPHYVYFILLTGRDDRESLLAGMEAGADDFLVKPMDFQELLVRIRAGERILGLEHKLEERNQVLETLNVELAKAYETMKTDVNLAAEVQKSLLPKPQNWPGAKLNWLFIPSNFLAGDMFGYYPVDENHLAFFQLDVSGHGVSSALISFSFSKQLSQDRLGSIGAPCLGLPAPADATRTAPNEVIAALNRRFSAEPESWSFFLTMVYGIMDRSSGEIILSSAGHPQALWWHQENGTISESKLSGVPIGVAPNSTYTTETLNLEPGDRLFIYSDGIIECENPSGEFFGAERLQNLLRTAASSSLAEITETVWNHLKNWRGKDFFEDDISLLILER